MFPASQIPKPVNTSPSQKARLTALRLIRESRDILTAVPNEYGTTFGSQNNDRIDRNLH
jgi:hypothetical protein